MFQPVRIARASQEIVEQIKASIISSQLPPGERLPTEREMAEQFKVSRITVRDALRVLESQGLVAIKVGAGGGAFVAKPSIGPVSELMTDMLRRNKASIHELVEARMIIETSIAGLAAERATAEDLGAMEQAIAEARSGYAAGDPHFTPHSVEFHVALAHAAKNDFLLFTVNSFRSLFYEVLEELIPAPDMSERAIEDHQKILDALKGRQANRARELMREHLAYFQARVQKMDSSGRNPKPVRPPVNLQSNLKRAGPTHAAQRPSRRRQPVPRARKSNPDVKTRRTQNGNRNSPDSN